MKHLHLFERATRLGITYDDAYRYRHPCFGEERLVDAPLSLYTSSEPGTKRNNAHIAHGQRVPRQYSQVKLEIGLHSSSPSILDRDLSPSMIPTFSTYRPNRNRTLQPPLPRPGRGHENRPSIHMRLAASGYGYRSRILHFAAGWARVQDASVSLEAS